MVLRQPNMEWEGIEHPNDLVSDWDDETDDSIPRILWINVYLWIQIDMVELDNLIALWNYCIVIVGMDHW